MGSIKHSPGRPCCGDVATSVASACCFLPGSYVNGAALLPASAVIGDPEDCTAGYYPYANLIVEIPSNGFFAAGLPCHRSYLNGQSFSVPNGVDGLTVGHTIYKQGCVWQKQFTFTATGCPSPGPHKFDISVSIIPGAIRARLSYISAGVTSDGVNFNGTIAAPGLIDLTAPYYIPFQAEDTVFVWTAAIPPLLVHF